MSRPSEIEPRERPAEGAATGEPRGDAASADLGARIRGINEENERLFRRLVEGERRFRGLARAVWEVQEEERRRIARELHDGLGQTLTALKIRLERLGARAAAISPELAGEVAAAVEIAGVALAEARRLAHLLRPQMLDDLGLCPALSWLARTLGEWAGFGVTLEAGLDPEERLDPEVETLAFRVVQESLTNAMRHSGAAGARVSVARAADRLTVRISDAGRGFDPAAVLAPAEEASGFGLRGMRDRVELAGGSFRIVSGPGEGARIEASLPLAGREAEA